MKWRTKRHISVVGVLSDMMDDNAAALDALRGPGELAAFAPTRRMQLCPHCQRGFGSASILIHVPRCRALLAPPEPSVHENEEAKEEKKKTPKPKKVQSLVDMCLRFIIQNIQVILIDKVLQLPEAHAALIDSLPPDLVHRVIVNLVEDINKLQESANKERRTYGELERQVQQLQQENTQLTLVRRQAANLHARLNSQDQVLERLRNELLVATHKVAAAETQRDQLTQQYQSFDRHQLRLEAKVNSLSADNERLKVELKAAHNREMEAVKAMASMSRRQPVSMERRTKRVPKDRENVSQNQRSPSHSQATLPPPPPPTVVGKKAARSIEHTSPRPERILKKRPHSSVSSIPLPNSLSLEYLSMVSEESS